jgi:hypothetical protein
VRHPRHGLDASLGYRFVRYQNVDADLEAIDPNAPASDLPEVGDLAQLDVGLSYSSQQSYRFSYGTEVGRRIRATLSVLDRRLGGDFGDLQVGGDYIERLPMPWRGHQVLSLGLAGGASAGGLARRGAFRVGGFSQQSQDVVRSLLVRSGWFERGLLRGYPRTAASGRHFAVLNAEYRVPILDVDRGPGSIPLLFERIVVAVFTDWGHAWSEEFRFSELLGSVGASLIWGLRVGYGERITLMLQYAHGFRPDLGLDYFRALVATSF